MIFPKLQVLRATIVILDSGYKILNRVISFCNSVVDTDIEWDILYILSLLFLKKVVRTEPKEVFWEVFSYLVDTLLVTDHLYLVSQDKRDNLG